MTKQTSLHLLLAILLSSTSVASPNAGGPASPQSQHASPISRHFALLQASRLPQELVNQMLELAMANQIPTLAHAAIVRGADSNILHSNSIRLTNWDFLVLNEHILTIEGKECTYSPEDWAIVFNQGFERYLATDSTKSIIQHLMGKGVSINAASKDGSPLELALKTGQKPILQHLLEVGASTDQLSEEQKAELQGRLDHIYVPNPTTPKENATAQQTAQAALTQATRSMSEEDCLRAKELIQALPAEEAQTLLTEATGRVALFNSKRQAALTYLIGLGADINAQWHFNDDPMRNIVFLAATGVRPEIECVKMLMTQGARFLPTDSEGKGVNAQDELGRTPLLIHLSGFNYSGTSHLANPSGVECIIQAGADVNIADKEGRTAIFYATSERHIKELAVIIKNNALVNHRDNKGRTALFGMVEQGNILGTMMMLESLANPFVIDHSGMDIPSCKPDMTHKSDYDDNKHIENVQTCIELVRAYQGALAPLNE